ncbi:hypothetical protein NS115_08035 [Paenibacillus jamilae]|uniref:Uncharacterized protein n=1 Tax=Paenibacillus jamilae TaxID=114136 RepID=A0ACC4ZX00_9BACL|nr:MULTISPECIES: hypothetical protein [Paenibacillus]MEE4567629.1 hypothetical protein [Paenibacillus polymyxa]AUO06645.1 hypothetical protein C0638_08905 [Paenibacillus sp. lzh-N1]AZH31723.1 hypothetical protein EGM68_24695 [Paenibacillus sp. M-152]KTS83226.1 hypothetical protein NS115_08035 [Paenibacillus jamilae]MBU9706176.1 hypothetical protein [Paenibacillus sp. AK121]
MADHQTSKDIFRECCSRIAAACEPCGFKYYKSRRSMVKHVDPFTAEVRFSSNAFNVAGSYLEFNVNCQIMNTQSGKVYWAISLSSFRNKGKVWNLAKETSREKELAEIITLIRDKVVPLVDKYGANLDEVLEQAILTGWFLPQSNPMEFYVLDVLDLVVDFGSPVQVTECAHRYIRHLSEEMQNTFRKDYEAYQRDEQAASTIAFRKLIPLMVERNISLPQ